MIKRNDSDLDPGFILYKQMDPDIKPDPNTAN